MDEVKVVKPVWFAKTKSWWLGILPGILTALDYLVQVMASEAAGPLTGSIAVMLQALGFDVTGEQVAGFLRGLAGLYTVIVAYQRRGVNQPYVATPSGERQTVLVKKEN